MAARKIKNQPDSLVGTPIAIYYDSERQEYQVKIKGQPDATYYTNDKNDATSTAQHMRNTIAYKNPAPKRKTSARTQSTAEAYVRRPSQVTKKSPSNRLKKRRTINLRVPEGVFPNPAKLVSRYDVQYFDAYGAPKHIPFHYKKDAVEFSKDKIEATIFDRQLNKNVWTNSMAGKGPFNNPAARQSGVIVQCSKNKTAWKNIATFPPTKEGAAHAIEYAKAYNAKMPSLYIRVMEK